MLIEREPPINFVELVLDLRRHRWTLKRIAEAINVPISTLGRWFYESATPNFDDGRALVKLHEQVTKIRGSEENSTISVSQSASHARGAQRQERKSMAKRPRQVREPGAEPQAETPDSAAAQSDPDAAIVAARAGKARKIEKPKPAVPKSRVVGDPERPAEAAVNAKREMSYDEAMALRSEGKLDRSVLTEQGWVMRNETEDEKRAAARTFARM